MVRLRRATCAAALVLAAAAAPAHAAYRYSFDLTDVFSFSNVEMSDISGTAVVEFTPGTAATNHAAGVSIIFAPGISLPGTIGFNYNAAKDRLTIGLITSERGDSVIKVGSVMNDFRLMIGAASTNSPTFLGFTAYLTATPDTALRTAGPIMMSIPTTGFISAFSGSISTIAVPEPASMLLLGGAVAGLLAAARRRR